MAIPHKKKRLVTRIKGTRYDLLLSMVSVDTASVVGIGMIDSIDIWTSLENYNALAT